MEPITVAHVPLSTLSTAINATVHLLFSWEFIPSMQVMAFKLKNGVTEGWLEFCNMPGWAAGFKVWIKVHVFDTFFYLRGKRHSYIIFFLLVGVVGWEGLGGCLVQRKHFRIRQHNLRLRGRRNPWSFITGNSIPNFLILLVDHEERHYSKMLRWWKEQNSLSSK